MIGRGIAPLPRGGAVHAGETERDRTQTAAQTTETAAGGPTPCWCGGVAPL